MNLRFRFWTVMSDQYELKDIRCFLSIARAGSISRAATTYNIPKATLSHHLRRLEDALHVELFVRKAKGLELTDAGKEFLDHASIIFDTCENAVSAAQRAHSTISGRIRIVASSAFGTSLIGAAAHYFAVHNPQIDFDLQMYPNDKIIAGQFDFDCMIFVGDPPTSSLLRRKMGNVSFGLYASPHFIEQNGMPGTLEDVNTCHGVVYMRNGLPEPWRVRNGKRSSTSTRMRASTSTNTGWRSISPSRASSSATCRTSSSATRWNRAGLCRSCPNGVPTTRRSMRSTRSIATAIRASSSWSIRCAASSTSSSAHPAIGRFA